eukprot:451483-Hanusia_phi.AAC.1
MALRRVTSGPAEDPERPGRAATGWRGPKRLELSQQREENRRDSDTWIKSGLSDERRTERDSDTQP